MAELADALDLGSSTRKGVEVQVLSLALQMSKRLTANRRESFFVCPAKLANPVAACQRPRPVHGEENPIYKGVAGQRRGLKEVIGS